MAEAKTRAYAATVRPPLQNRKLKVKKGETKIRNIRKHRKHTSLKNERYVFMIGKTYGLQKVSKARICELLTYFDHESFKYMFPLCCYIRFYNILQYSSHRFMQSVKQKKHISHESSLKLICANKAHKFRSIAEVLSCSEVGKRQGLGVSPRSVAPRQFRWLNAGSAASLSSVVSARD